MSALRDLVLGNGEMPKLAERVVTVEEWSAEVRMIALDFDRMTEYLDADKGDKNKRRHAALVVATAHDLDGKRLFAMSDLERLCRWPGPVMQLWNVAYEMNPWLFDRPEKNAATPGVSPAASA